MLIHLLDGNSADAIRDMTRVNEELSLFDLALARKPQLVAVNKIDLPEVQEQLDSMRETFNDVGINVFFISAETVQGVSEVMAEALDVLGRLKVEKKPVPVAGKVFRPKPRGGVPSIRREGEIYVIVAPELERLMTRGGAVSHELRYQLRQQLNRLGVNKQLEKAGIRAGDRVRCGNLEWEW